MREVEDRSFRGSFATSLVAVSVWAIGLLASGWLAGPVPAVPSVREDQGDHNRPRGHEQLSSKSPELAADASYEEVSAVLEQGYRANDSQAIMSALEAYKTLLERNPDDTRVLLSLARVSSDFGVFDRAVTYLEHYLEIEPSDTDRLAELAFLQMRAGNTDGSLSVLHKLISLDAKSFQGHIGLAINHKMSGRTSEAVEEAVIAREFAPDEEALSQVNQLIQELNGAADTGDADHETGKLAEVTQESPAAMFKAFFENHPILGGKVVGFRWKSAQELAVLVREFPVDQMPEFAKASLEQKLREMVADLDEDFMVELVDSDSEGVLLSFDLSSAKAH